MVGLLWERLYADDLVVNSDEEMIRKLNVWKEGMVVKNEGEQKTKLMLEGKNKTFIHYTNIIIVSSA